MTSEGGVEKASGMCRKEPLHGQTTALSLECCMDSQVDWVSGIKYANGREVGNEVGGIVE